MSYNDYIIIQGSKAVQAMNNDRNTSFGPEFNTTVQQINALDKTITNKLAKQKKNKNLFLKKQLVKHLNHLIIIKQKLILLQ